MLNIRKTIAVVAVLLVAFTGVVNAQSYDDVTGNTIDFANIDETTGEGIFGQPTAVGDDLSFPVSGFNAEAVDGAIDFVNGIVRLDVSANSGQTFSSIALDEFGVYFNTGNSVSSVDAFLTVITSDGTFSDTFSFSFGAGSGVWDGVAEVFFPETDSAKVFVHNILLADSEVGSVASINKRNATIRVGNNVIPEPTTFGILALGMIGMAARRRR